ncbi:MAG TPA: hypothetical protein VGC29_07835 [Flavisolibacter sp.]
MKRFNFLSMAIAAILMVAAVGCTTLTESQDDRYERVSGANRIYVDDPYRGLIVLERDPWTGRYYEVNSYNDRYYRGYDRYGYGNRNYGRRDNRYYRGGNTSQPQQPTEEQKRQHEQNKNEARKKVLGN